MKAISIKQPWASLIVHGIKDIENRTWTCSEKYLGQRVLIHVSKRKRWVEPTSIFTEEQFNRIVMSILEFFSRFKCTKDEKEKLLDHLCAIRVKRIIKEIDNLKARKI